jgi:O-antigen ligase
VISERISTISESTEATAANQRPYIWSKTPGIIGDHPFFGVGAGQYPLYAPDYDIVDYGGAPFVHAHDVPLTIGAENGLIGLAFLLAFGIGVTAVGVRLVLRQSDSTEYAFGVAAAAAVLAAFITGLADYPPGTVVIMGMTFVVIGALVATERLSRPDEPASTKKA